MGIKKLIAKTKVFLNQNKFGNNDKKKPLINLLKKFKSRKEILSQAAKENLSAKKREELEEELEIITLQIKKGEKLLDKLNS